jgi:hypothetical protein
MQSHAVDDSLSGLENEQMKEKKENRTRRPQLRL